MSSFALKLVAMGAMLIDHLGLVLLYSGVVSGWLYTSMRVVGRLAMPIFCFFIVVGLQKSSDRKKYLYRLSLFALISQLPFVLVLSPMAYFIPLNAGVSISFAALSPFQWGLLALTAAGLVAFFGKSSPLPLAALLALFLRLELGGAPLSETGNVYYDLALGLSLIWFLDEARKEGRDIKKLLPAAALLLCALLLITPGGDYGWKALALILPLYLCGERKWARLICVALWGAAIYAPGTELMLGAACAVVPLAFYNGRRGPALRYVFYVFYPAHLTLLIMLGRALTMYYH